MRDTRQLLSSCFHVRARLSASLAAVRCELSAFRCLRPCSSGSRLVYAVVDAKKNGDEALLELCKDTISLRFFFARPDRAEYTDNLLKFFSILAYLNGLYSVDFAEVYGYAVEALRNNWSFSVLEDRPRDDVFGQRVDALSCINATLSKEFMALSRDNRELKTRIKTYRSFCAEVLEKTAAIDGTSVVGKHAVLHSLGIDSEKVSAVASLLAEKE